MRKIFFFLLIALFISCKASDHNKDNKVIQTIDTVYIQVPSSNDDKIKELELNIKNYKQKIDSLNTTISYENYSNARMIEKIKYYISICEKRTTNKKFFYGWIKRTVKE